MTHHRSRSIPRALTRSIPRSVQAVGAAAALVLGTAVAVLAPAAPAAAATMSTLYASPTGSGTACTSTAPCSLAGAKAAVESQDSAMTGDILVELAGGTYRLTAPFTLTGADSATNGHAIDWQAESGQIRRASRRESDGAPVS